MNESDKNLSAQHFGPVRWDDSVVVAVWSVVLTYGLTTNLLTLLGVWRNKSMRSATSYWLILSVSLCDVMMILISLTHLLPATLFHDRFVLIDEYRNAFAIFLYNVFWYSGVVQLAGMAINRYVNIVHALYYSRLFTPCYTMLFLLAMYAVGVAASMPALFPCCLTVYDHELWVTYYYEKDSDYYLVDLILNSCSLAVMIVCYGCILWKVRKSQSTIRRHKLDLTYGGSNIISLIISTTNSSGLASANNHGDRPCVNRKLQRRITTIVQPSRREMKLLTQFLIVSLVFLLTFLMWQWLFKLPSASKWIYFTTTTFFFINNAVNPTVYLIYNSTLRKEVGSFLPPLFFYFSNKNPLKQRQQSQKAEYRDTDDESNAASGEKLNTPTSATPERKPPRLAASCVNRSLVEIETSLNS